MNKPIEDMVFGMSAAARDVMRCLFFNGPTLDGDVPSKNGRDEICSLGYAERWDGWQWLTKTGVQFAVNSMLMEGQKAKWQRERSHAIHQMRHPT